MKVLEHFNHCKIAWLVFTFLLLALSGCENEDYPVTDFYTIRDRITVNGGDALTAENVAELKDYGTLVVPASAAIGKLVSHNSEMLWGGSSGTLYALKKGTTQVDVLNMEGNYLFTVDVEILSDAPDDFIPDDEGGGGSSTLELNLTSGSSYDLARDLDGTKHVLKNLKSSNPKVVSVSLTSSVITALAAGEAVITSPEGYPGQKKVYIVVRVKGGNLTNFFKNLSGLSSYMYIYETDVDRFMSGYNCVFSGEATYEGKSYYMKEYRPFDKATSITFYLDNNPWKKELKFAIIETGQPSDEVRMWLCEDYEAYIGAGGIEYFKAESLNIYPINGSWSTLRVQK